MTRMSQVSLLVAALFAAVPGPAPAQVRCIAGVAANGDCANASLGALARRTAVIFSQPKISQTAYPVLPWADRIYRYPHQLNPNPQPATPVGPGPNFEFPGGST
ncbi:MAG TPA: hypothetical protein VH765_15365 [Xanthobacteraceae bacterium]|jgi:hypothetical protein